MKILITGCCGFIGFNLSKKLLQNKRNKIFGIDNMNNYYSVKLKKERLKQLSKEKNFLFRKVDLKNFTNLHRIFQQFKPDYIYHFAAQAGVQYSIKHPRKYVDYNINAFFNILELAKEFKIKKVLFASSSSVYGDQKAKILSEKLKLNPKNFYGLTKKNNEEMAEIYSNLYNIDLVGLRFFSVFGEWGRPDMLIFKFLLSAKNKKTFYINNFGRHVRDFTYISDVTNILDKLRFKKLVNKFNVFNICSNKPIKLLEIINYLNSRIIIKPNIIKRNFQIGDIYKTHGDNKKIKKVVKIRFSDFYKSLDKTIKWHKEYLKLD